MTVQYWTQLIILYPVFILLQLLTNAYTNSIYTTVRTDWNPCCSPSEFYLFNTSQEEVSE